MFGPPAYEHTQQGWIHWLMYVIVIPLLSALYLKPNDPVLMILAPVLVFLFLGLAFTFRDLTVRDSSEELVIEFGPIHLFRKRVSYADVVAVETARSRLIDGWGIHYGVGKGWIWNIAGFDCVQLTMKDRGMLRIGTDDPQGLCGFLQTKIQKQATAPAG